MKTETKIVCDFCGREVLLGEHNSAGSNPLRGWISIREEKSDEIDFCSANHYHRYKQRSEQPDLPHINSKFPIDKITNFFRRCAM